MVTLNQGLTYKQWLLEALPDDWESWDELVGINAAQHNRRFDTVRNGLNRAARDLVQQGLLVNGIEHRVVERSEMVIWSVADRVVRRNPNFKPA